MRCYFSYSAPAAGNYTLSYSTYDYGNNPASGSLTFALGDVVPPVVSLTYPADGASIGTTTSKFNFTMYDTNFTANSTYTNNTCTLYINGTAYGNATSLNSSTTNGSITNNANLTNGTYTWLIACTDGSGNTANSASRTLYVDNSTGPSLTVTAPPSYSYYNRTITVAYTVSSFSFNRTTVNLLNGTSGALLSSTNVSGAGTVSVNLTAPGDYLYNVSVTAYDNLNRNTAVTKINVTAEATAPTLAIIWPNSSVLYAPTNATYNSSVVKLNFTATDAFSVANCSYSTDGNGTWTPAACSNTSMINVSLGSFASGTHTVQVKANDSSGNVRYASATFVVDTAATSTTTVSNSGTVAVAANTTNVALLSNVSNANITANSSVMGDGTAGLNITIPTLSLTTDNLSATLNGTLNATINTTGISYRLEFQTANTTITGPTNWSGALQLPTVKSTTSVSPPSVSGYNSAVLSVVEVGFGSERLNLSSPARLVMAGQGGAQHVGYSRSGGTITPITATCDNDTSAGIGSNNECVIYGNTGGDLVIWTTHFTSFSVFALTPTTSSGNGGSTYNPAPPNVMQPVTTTPTTTPSSNPSTSKTLPTPTYPNSQPSTGQTPPTAPTKPSSSGSTPTQPPTQPSSGSKPTAPAAAPSGSNNFNVEAPAAPAPGGDAFGVVLTIIGLMVVVGLVGAAAYLLLKPEKKGRL
ncbi:Uncharacterised protein [uncultured archaeon]|nr:Uncharacterised protein [uncultured archaeon]